MRAFACEADLTSASVCERSLGCRYVFRWPTGQGREPDRDVSVRWAERKGDWSNSPTWRNLKRQRGVPAAIIEAASVAGVDSACFDLAGAVAHVDVEARRRGGLRSGICNASQRRHATN